MSVQADRLDEAFKRANARRAAQIARARVHAEDMIEFCMAHERTGKPLVNAPFHREWHRLLREHKQVVLMASVEHAKTQQIAVGATLHALGTDPSIRCAIVSNSGGQSGKIMGAIRRHIDENARLAEVFPGLRRSPKEGDPWHSGAITVARDTISKDPSVQAVGVQGKVLGSRLDLIIVDDVLDFENTRGNDQIKKVIDWFDSTILSRLTDGGRVWCIGTPWHPSDLLHVLSTRHGWAHKKYPAVLNPSDPPAIWEPRWPEQFSRERLENIVRSMTPLNFSRSYLCEARSDGASRFQESWIKGCMELGKGRTLVQRAPVTGGGRPLPCFTGVDLAIGKDQDSHLTAMVTIALDPSGKRIVCDISSGRWQAPEILSRLKNIHDRFGSIILVEDNGAQSFLLQWAGGMGIPVRPFTTGRNKTNEHFGVESIAVEMRSGLWVIPSGMTGADTAPEVDEWVREMLFYTPEGHTGDRLMASWFAREAARTFAQGFTKRMDTLTR